MMNAQVEQDVNDMESFMTSYTSLPPQSVDLNQNSKPEMFIVNTPAIESAPFDDMLFIPPGYIKDSYVQFVQYCWGAALLEQPASKSYDSRTQLELYINETDNVSNLYASYLTVSASRT